MDPPKETVFDEKLDCIMNLPFALDSGDAKAEAEVQIDPEHVAFVQGVEDKKILASTTTTPPTSPQISIADQLKEYNIDDLHIIDTMIDALLGDTEN